MSAIAAFIDHTLLRPDATAGEIRKVCERRAGTRLRAVCVNPYLGSLVAAELAGSPVRFAP